MERFELSFNNKHIRVWFMTVLPAGVIAALFFLILPREYHLLPAFLPAIGLIIYVIWAFFNKRRREKLNERKFF